jgi:hypothetical protein
MKGVKVVLLLLAAVGIEGSAQSVRSRISDGEPEAQKQACGLIPPQA